MNVWTVRTLAAAWLALFAASFVALMLTPPEGEGFTRGLNRIASFLTWQGAALVVAIACALVTRGGAPRLHARTRMVGYAPIAVSVVIVAAVVAIIGYRVLVEPNFGG